MLYKHTQMGTAIIVLLVVITASLTIFMPAPISFTILGVGILFILLFASLTIEITAEHLKVRFGIGIIRISYPLTQMHATKIVRNRWYYGLGIRLTPHGWLYCISGLDAVEVILKNGKRVRFGTDQPQQLKQAIDEAAGTAEGKEAEVPVNKKNELWLVLAIILIIAMVVGGFLFYSHRNPKIEVTTSHFSISGMYGLKQSWKDVTSIELKAHLPKILKKSNGYNFNHVLKGNFVLAKIGKGKLFLRNKKSPFIYIWMGTKFIIINCPKSQQTKDLYDVLKNKGK